MSEVMELPVPNSLDAAAGSVVKSSHEITARVAAGEKAFF